MSTFMHFLSRLSYFQWHPFRRYIIVFGFAVICFLLLSLVEHPARSTVIIENPTDVPTLNECANFSMKAVDPNAKISVILSVSLHKRYLFTLPFTVAGWRKLGVKPIVIFVGDYDIFQQQHQSKVTIDLLLEIGSTIHYIKNETLAATTLSQTSRLFAAALPISKDYADDDIFITSDADVVPFHLADHIPNVAVNQKLYIYTAGCYGSVRVPPRHGYYYVPQYSMITLGATVSAWREIMGFRTTNFTGPDIEWYLKKEFGLKFFSPTDGENPKLKKTLLWYTDQSLVSYKISEWFKKNPANEYATTKNRPCARRIDRLEWPDPKEMEEKNLADWDDAHFIEWGFKDDQWQLFQPFVNLLFKGNEYESLRNRLYTYRKEYIAKDCC